VKKSGVARNTACRAHSRRCRRGDGPATPFQSSCSGALEIGVAPDTHIRLGESVILSATNSIAGERVITITDASGALFFEHLNPES